MMHWKNINEEELRVCVSVQKYVLYFWAPLN